MCLLWQKFIEGFSKTCRIEGITKAFDYPWKCASPQHTKKGDKPPTNTESVLHLSTPKRGTNLRPTLKVCFTTTHQKGGQTSDKNERSQPSTKAISDHWSIFSNLSMLLKTTHQLKQTIIRGLFQPNGTKPQSYFHIRKTSITHT